MAKGIIYLMSTCIDGLIKIGKTDNFERRMSQLERDGYHRVSVLKREFAIEVDDYDEKEALIHEIFSKSRVGDSELFTVDINLVQQLLSSLDGKQIYPVNETKKDVFEKATEAVQKKLVPDGEYYMSVKVKDYNIPVKAKMSVNNGKFILLKGSLIAPYKQFQSPSWIELRKKMKLDNNTLLSDVECSSPSMAASLVSGHAKNGWSSWKNNNNEYIDVYRQHNDD